MQLKWTTIQLALLLLGLGSVAFFVQADDGSDDDNKTTVEKTHGGDDSGLVDTTEKPLPGGDSRDGFETSDDEEAEADEPESRSSLSDGKSDIKEPAVNGSSRFIDIGGLFGGTMSNIFGSIAQQVAGQAAGAVQSTIQSVIMQAMSGGLSGGGEADDRQGGRSSMPIPRGAKDLSDKFTLACRQKFSIMAKQGEMGDDLNLMGREELLAAWIEERRCIKASDHDDHSKCFKMNLEGSTKPKPYSKQPSTNPAFKKPPSNNPASTKPASMNPSSNKPPSNNPTFNKSPSINPNNMKPPYSKFTPSGHSHGGKQQPSIVFGIKKPPTGSQPAEVPKSNPHDRQPQSSKKPGLLPNWDDSTRYSEE